MRKKSGKLLLAGLSIFYADFIISTGMVEGAAIDLSVTDKLSSLNFFPVFDHMSNHA